MTDSDADRMRKQIDRIREKLLLLRHDDKYRRYQQMNPCLSEQAIQSFERRHRMRLPEGYRLFLQEVGDGGIGPSAKGLTPLDEAIHRQRCWHPNPNPYALSKPFPLTEPLLMINKVSERFGLEKFNFTTNYALDDDYMVYAQSVMERCGERFHQVWQEVVDEFESPDYTQGAVYLSGNCELLVVTGPEAGNVWADARAYDFGIFPLRHPQNPAEHIDFLSWYEKWLDYSLIPAKDDA